MEMPVNKKATLNAIANDLQQITGIIAVVLGGSFAAGMANRSSDLDIGLYYSEKQPFSIADIKEVAKRYLVADRMTVTDFYAWGPWVNGGAWVQTSSGKVDILYRNLDQVADTINKAKNGQWENHFEQQPPYGFSSLIYLSEIETCFPLYDPNDRLVQLKKELRPYPIKLKEAVVQQSLWAAEFAIWHAEHFFSKDGDVYNTVGCLTRAVKNIVTALFAINEIYPLGDKRAIAILEKSQNCPAMLREKIENILVVKRKAINDNIHFLKILFTETVDLSEDFYKPFYDLNDI
jgi:predicted nucleotidyltransferase